MHYFNTLYGVIGEAHIGAAAGLYALTDGGLGVLTGVTLARESGRESQLTPTCSMSNVECGNSSSNSAVKKLLLSEDGPQRSEDEFRLLRGDTIEPSVEALPPMPPPLILPPFPESPGAPEMLPPIPCPTMFGPAIPTPPDPPPSMPGACPGAPLCPAALPPPLRTLAIKGPPILLTPCRNSFDWLLTWTYTSGQPRRSRYVSSSGVPFADRTLPRCSVRIDRLSVELRARVMQYVPDVLRGTFDHTLRVDLEQGPADVRDVVLYCLEVGRLFRRVAVHRRLR
uniref:Uncharacterized protein n=1 Tax=Anopheles atroparvus TaxID=41427 RepID=A0A182JH68_ANOAO